MVIDFDLVDSKMSQHAPFFFSPHFFSLGRAPCGGSQCGDLGCVWMLSRMPRSYLKATSTRFATALLALTCTPTAVSFSAAHPGTPFRRFAWLQPGSLQNPQRRFGLLSRGEGGGGTVISEKSMSTTADETTTQTADAATAQEPRLSALRQEMEELNLDVYLVPSDDPHLSEYTPDAYKRRAFLTGFAGSAGTAVVTRDEALLWTDSR